MTKIYNIEFALDFLLIFSVNHNDMKKAYYSNGGCAKKKLNLQQREK
jgi:hypothetical protein